MRFLLFIFLFFGLIAFGLDKAPVWRNSLTLTKGATRSSGGFANAPEIGGLTCVGRFGFGRCEAGFGVNTSGEFITSMSGPSGTPAFWYQNLDPSQKIVAIALCAEGQLLENYEEFSVKCEPVSGGYIRVGSVTSVSPNNVVYNNLTSRQNSVTLWANANAVTSVMIAAVLLSGTNDDGYYTTVEVSSEEPPYFESHFDWNTQWGKVNMEYVLYFYAKDSSSGGGGGGSDTPDEPENPPSNDDELDKIADNTDNIKDNTNDIKDNTKEIKDNTNDIKDNTNDIKDDTNDIKNHTENISNNTQNITNNTNDIKNHTENISNNTQNITNNTNDIKNHTENISNNTQNITNNTTNIASDTGEIVDILNDKLSTNGVGSGVPGGVQPGEIGEYVEGETVVGEGEETRVNLVEEQTNGLSSRFNFLDFSSWNPFRSSGSLPTIDLEFPVIGTIEMRFDSPVFLQIARVSKWLLTITLLVWVVLGLYKRFSTL